jgi:RNA polymerase sigma-70 factor, ECF subfamily
MRTHNQRIREGCYHTPDGDELWALLLVIALREFRDAATDRHAVPLDSHPMISSIMARTRLESPDDVRESSYAYLELVLEEILERLPPQNRVMVKLRLDGCEVAEIARLTGRSRRSAERILEESRVKLGAFLQKEKQDVSSGGGLSGNGTG